MQAEYQSDAKSIKDAPYLRWAKVVFCEYFLENLPRYNGTALYLARGLRVKKGPNIYTADNSAKLFLWLE